MSLEHELRALREGIKCLTEEIIRLAWRRINLTIEVGKIKKTYNLPIEDESVEKDLENETLKLCTVEGINREFALKILRLLIDESKRFQNLLYEKEDSVSLSK